MDIFPATDPNIEETQEWRDALLSLIASDGPGRAVQILDELVRLTHAHERGEIGPKTFQRARQGLLDAAARLNQQLTGAAS